ncbi:M1-specific T cell receptor alpha chain-like [Pelobates fuscus]|uniref:M1-specific T cell receptor alpha chain-like n=1 Tax=Pelobates fuscus TaxID=191477 RepID=UPI002FE4928A
MFSFFCLLILFLYAESNSQVQQSAEVTSLEGQNAAISCNHTISNYDRLYWYKEHDVKGLEIIISGYRTTEHNGPFSLVFSTDKLSATLHIKDVQVAQTGTYHCAHCDNNVNKLVFGKGTRLHVTPKIHEHTTPSVYILKSNENKGQLPSSVCLVTDFPSSSGSIRGYQYDEKSERERNDTLLLDSSGQEWRYGSIFWDDKPLDEPKCNVKYNDGQLQTKADTHTDKCSESSNQDYYETDERINTTSLTVFGLRLLTVKAIVFNMIITLRLWSS